ncbi:DUF202 domain-containing protein [Cupriavidus sp. EM10]|nr:DUF202 domain-containing protein [Cupriavidus sp. EM10]
MQPERTSLAWGRTGWASAVIAVGCARAAVSGQSTFRALAILVGVASLAVALACGFRGRELKAKGMRARPRPLVMIWISAWLTLLSAFVALYVSHLPRVAL